MKTTTQFTPKVRTTAAPAAKLPEGEAEASPPGLEQGPGGLRKAVKWLDEYSRPRPSTAGDLEKNSYVQPLFHAASAGFAFMGLRGVGIAGAASVAGTWVGRRTESRVAALAAGSVAGGVAAAALGSLSGPLAPVTIVGGALLGGLQSFRGDKAAAVRDASGNATMITGLFLPGTAKIAGAIGSGLGASVESPLGKAAIGALTAGGLGAALAATGMAPGGVLLTAGISAAAGAAGPFFGPRFSQFFRNVANDAGKGAMQLLDKAGMGEKVSETTANSIGAFPAQFLKEGVRGFINSDFQVSGMVIGGLSEAVELIELFQETKKNGSESSKADGASSTEPKPAAG